MAMDDGRAVQVYTEGLGSGSGYAITSKCVLTARHVVVGTGAVGRPEVRVWGDLRKEARHWMRAHVLWSHPTLDVALLTFENEELLRSAPLKTLAAEVEQTTFLAGLPSIGESPVEAFGWPRVMKEGVVQPPLPFHGSLTVRGRAKGTP